MPESDVSSLLSGLAAGDPSAFAELLDNWGTRLYRAALRLVDCPADAEDVVQETCAALVRLGEKLSEVQDFEAYLFTILRREAARCRERRGPRARSLDFIAELPGTASRELSSPVNNQSADLTAERRERLELAMHSLPVEQREVLALKLSGELTFAQIGAVLRISPHTAASRYRYALEKLRAQLENACR